MADHPNAALTRRVLDEFNSGGFEGMADFLADDVVWHEIGLAEPRRGKAEMLAGNTGSDAQITGTLHDVIANDDHTIALVEATATRNGKTFTYRTAEIMHIRDGKVTERWAYSDDTAAIVDFFK